MTASAPPSDPSVPNSESLLGLRVQIDSLDQQLLGLLNQRAHVAEQVGEIKKREGTPFFRPDRVAQVIEKMQHTNAGPLKDLHVAAIWREIMSACLALESPQRVAVLGPEGTFCEQAAIEYFGGAADLTASTKTIFKDSPSFHVDPTGRNVFFGVREFGMCAMVNGMAAHGGLIPFGSTFFVFSDYCRSALRMAALMSVHSLFVFTHDSVGLGEDGPTHQPIEQLMSLRAIPQLTDFRPADANETAAAWRLALERKSASFMALSRQDLPVLDNEKYKVQEGCNHGAYILEKGTDIILLAAGSEVALIMEAAAKLKAEGISATVISMPSFRIFDEQSDAYKASLFPEGTPKIAIEAGATMGWYKYVGHNGVVIGLDRFGASAPGPIALEKLGISVAHVIEHAKKLVKK